MEEKKNLIFSAQLPLRSSCVLRSPTILTTKGFGTLLTRAALVRQNAWVSTIYNCCCSQKKRIRRRINDVLLVHTCVCVCSIVPFSSPTRSFLFLFFNALVSRRTNSTVSLTFFSLFLKTRKGKKLWYFSYDDSSFFFVLRRGSVNLFYCMISKLMVLRSGNGHEDDIDDWYIFFRCFSER